MLRAAPSCDDGLIRDGAQGLDCGLGQRVLLLALMLTGSNAQTVAVAVMSFWSSDAIQWGRIMAGSFIVLIPGVIFVLTCQRWLVKGLTMGSVKG